MNKGSITYFHNILHFTPKLSGLNEVKKRFTYPAAAGPI